MNILKEKGVTYYISVDKIDNTGSLDFALKNINYKGDLQ